MKTKHLLKTCSLALVGFLATGCASNQALRASLADRDDLIRTLRAESQSVQDRLQAVTYDRDQLQIALTQNAMEIAPVAVESALNNGAIQEPEIEFNMQALGEAGISVDRHGDSVIFGIPSSTTFPSGSATLSPDGENSLRAVVSELKDSFPEDAIFYIEGHTDNERIRRSKFSSNRDLSYHRARAVHEYLVTRGTIRDGRFVVVAHGPHSPRDTNDTDEGRSNNRRVEIVVRKSGDH